MTIELVRHVLGWCAIINLGLYLWWFLFIWLAHDWTYRFHTRWFNLSLQQFDAVHYAGLAVYKIAIFFFNLVPYFALRIVD